MKVVSELTDERVVNEVGDRIAGLRLERNLSQAQLADEAGLERKSVARLEAGAPVQLLTLIRVLRALGRLDALDTLVPERGHSAMDLLELRGRTRPRRRASANRRATAASDSSAWQWGDERT